MCVLFGASFTPKAFGAGKRRYSIFLSSSLAIFPVAVCGKASMTRISRGMMNVIYDSLRQRLASLVRRPRHVAGLAPNNRGSELVISAPVAI